MLKRHSDLDFKRFVTNFYNYVDGTIAMAGPNSAVFDNRRRKIAFQDSYQPILLCTTRIRLALRNLTERHMPQLTVLSYEEILPSVSVQVHAQVEV